MTKLSKSVFIISLLFLFVFISLSQVINTLKLIDLPKDALWLERLNLNYMSREWGSPNTGKSVDNNPLTFKGVTFPHGIGTHARSEIMNDILK